MVGLFNVNFFPAVKVPRGDNLPCRSSYIQENHGNIKPVDGPVVLGENQKGNYWVSAYNLVSERGLRGR